MTDRANEDSLAPQIDVTPEGDPVDRWIAARMYEACAHLRASGGMTFTLSDEGEIHVGRLCIALRNLPLLAAGPADAAEAALMCVLPHRDRHGSRHALALQLSAHALVTQGAALTAVGDGTLVLICPIDLHLHDCVALAAAMVRFANLAEQMTEQLGLVAGTWT
jgi:hypothetical protein